MEDEVFGPNTIPENDQSTVEDGNDAAPESPLTPIESEISDEDVSLESGLNLPKPNANRDLDPLTLKELQKVSVEIADIWYEVGLELDLPPYKLRTIKLDHPNENAKASLDMLLKWRDRNKGVSREVLNKAIAECRGNDLPPTTIEFGRISGEITEIWKRVGLELGLKPHKLNTIELEHVNSKRNASLDMLFTWRDANINVSRRVLNQATERAMKRCQANGDNTVANYSVLLRKEYSVQLKKRYSSGHVSNRWPPFTPKFINLGYIIHKPKRTAQETKFTVLTRSRNPPSKELTHSCTTFGLENDESSFDTSVFIEEEISNIFLPINNNEHPQIILIEGAPGIGKTMLMKQIRFLWATEKILKDKEMILFFSLCDPKGNEINAIEDMFSYSCIINREDAKIYANYFVINNGQGLVILLDGLDENPCTMQRGSFLYESLIKQKIFMEACIIITSRPHIVTELVKHVSYRVEIIGFTSRRRSEFVRENMKENADDLVKYLQNHEIIDTLCYIPLNMTIVLFLFNQLKKLPKTQTELTLPRRELFSSVIKMTVFYNLQKLGVTNSNYNFKNLSTPYDEIFHYVTALAYNAVAENKLTFTSDEIRRACPVPTNGNENIERAIINGLGLIHTARYYNDDSKIESLSYFAHYSIQEFLAAWYIAFSHRSYFRQIPLSCSIQKFLFQLKELKTNLWKIDYINVWSFYIALTGGNDLAFRYYLFGSFPCSMHCRSFHRLRQLFNIKWLLQEQTSNEIPDCLDGSHYMISKEILKNKLRTLLLYFWLQQEVPDHEVIKDLDVVVTKNKLDISKHILYLKYDVYLLGYILSRPYLTKQWELVNLSHCKIDDKIFEDLHDVLTRNDGRPKPEIKALSLSGNKLKSCSNAIANLTCCQNILYLNLSNNALDELASLKHCGEFLEFLDISNNKLNDKKALELFTAVKFLRKLKVLKLNHNNISNDKCVIDAIGLALCYCNLLKQLELDGNSTEFENKAMLYFQVVNEVRSSKSNVHYYRLSDKAFAFLEILGYCDQIDDQLDPCILKNKMMLSQIVNISYSGLRTDAGCSLGQKLHLLVNLKKLIITKNNISDKATKSLTMGLLLTPNLEEFKYDENLFSEDSTKIFNTVHQLRATRNVIIFKCAPSEIKGLVFVLKCLGELNEEELLLSDIASTISDIEELILSHDGVTQDYKITSRDIKELCIVLTWFKQLKVLDVRNNDINDEAKESLVLMMLQICTLNSLKLTGNPLTDNELTMNTFDTIKNLHENQGESIICDQKRSSYTCQSIIFIMECLDSLENPQCLKLFCNITTLDIDSESDYAVKLLEYLKFLPFLRKITINHVKCCITDYGINQLCKYLSRNKTLTTLDLSFCDLENFKIEFLKFKGGNCFGDKWVSYLHNALMKNDRLSTTITALNLAKNRLTSISAVKIVKMVEKCKVKYLNISQNCLGSIFPYFDQCTITTLEELNISGNYLQTCNAVQFAENISYLKSCSSLKKLNISNNNIDKNAIGEIYYSFMMCSHFEEVICKENPAENEIKVAFGFVQNLHTSIHNKNTFRCPPSKIKALVYLLRCIIDNEEKLQSLTSDMVSIMCLVTELNLSHNQPITLDYKLTSEDLKELCAVLTWFKQLEVLDARNNDITHEAKDSLAKVMLQISTLNILKLSGNPIFDDRLSMSVFDTIKNVREKQVKSIIDDQNSSSHIQCHCVICIMEYLNQLENPNCFKSFDNVTTLDIEAESEYASKFFEYLNYLPFLKNLKINNVSCITDYGIKQLSKYLSQNRTLITLDLSFCNLENLDIGNGPSNSIPLKVLKFYHSNITDKILFKLFLNMLMFSNLDELDLGRNFFGNSGISDLYDVLSSCKNDQFSMTITTLNLANNQLTSRSADKIIEIAQICKVRDLKISDNYLGSIFLSFEKFTITTLEELNISGNNHQTYNAVQFAENLSYLKYCSSLKKLDISNNSIDETAIDEAYCSFMECTHLEEMKCNENPAENDIKEAFDFVQNLYQQKQSYVEIINFKELPKAALTLISKTSLLHSELTATLVMSAEVKVSQVRSIDFSNNKMKIDKNFICVLQNCTQLEFLNLENNDITNDTFHFLATGFLFTSKLMLSNLHLKGNPCIENRKNESVLQMIESLRSVKNNFVCTPANFEIFLTILELVDGVNNKPNDIAKTISLIKTLNISNSELTSSLSQHTTKLQFCDIKNFCNYLNYFKSLESINMKHNNITGDVKDDLVIAVLRNYSITEIQLEGNPIHRITECCKLFETIGKLRRCRYKCPFIDIPQTLEALVNILQYVNNFADKTCDITNNTEHLDISSFYQPQHNPLHGIEKIHNPEKISTGLIYHLTLFCKLKTLNLHNAYLTLDSLKELSKFLCNNNTLQLLDISNNNVQAEGALIILRSLDTNTTLKTLNLSNNKITGAKCKEVIGIIGGLSNVKVDMSGNEPTKASKRFPRLKWPGK